MTGVHVRGLKVELPARPRHRVIDDIDFDIEAGEVLGVVGASGAGKSTIAWSLAASFPRHARVSADRFAVAGRDVLTLAGEALRHYRRDSVAIVPQEPLSALDPTARIGAQMAEVLPRTERSARRSIIASLADIGCREPESIARRFPHEISGGQGQRVVLAMALARRPRLLILDEPTTGLDAVSREEVLATINEAAQRQGSAVLLISHDRGLVSTFADRVGILNDGRLVATRSAESLIDDPRNASTRDVVALGRDDNVGVRRAAPPAVTSVVEVEDLSVRQGQRQVLDGVRLHISRGETLGLIGESGSGKTTLGRAIAGLIPHTGTVAIHAPHSPPPVQIVWQNADASLNPRRTVGQILGRAIRLLDGESTPLRLAEQTGLAGDVLRKLPHELSGGEKQRVAIARAFAGRAALVVCDEPTSALDAHNRETILELVADLQAATGAACLFISHDLAVVRRISHRVAVIKDGQILETVSAVRVDLDARHPYTHRLVAATDRSLPIARPGGRGS